MKNKKPLIGLLRIRNEALILKDTLDHMSEFCDEIYVFDDASTDGTTLICRQSLLITKYAINQKWDSNQTKIQGEQRARLFEYAKFQTELEDPNFIYMDTDERIEFDFKSWDGMSAVIMRLFDARMTPFDQEPYSSEWELKNFRKYFDPEYRDIPFIFNSKAKYIGVDCERYPQIDPSQKVIKAGFVQHYGKALSRQHWQDTCAYYAKYVPHYAAKWEARKKESGVVSSNNLLTWTRCLTQNKQN